MANLKELRNRIASVSSTMQITSAMKMVSAAKLKKAQDAVTQMRPYAVKLNAVLSNVSATLDASENPFAVERTVRRVLVLPVSSNRGLCGAFNTNVYKATRALIASYEDQGAQAEVWGVGKKASEPFRKLDLVTCDFNATMGAVSFAGAKEIGQKVMEAFTSGQVDAVYVVYNRFKNAAVQEVMTEQVLPIAAPAAEGHAAQSDYLYSPSKEEILLDLIPTTIKIQVFKALLDSVASEHGARMTAMHKATDNANSMRSELRLQYNKARQAAITNEILEIVAGAEALSG
ncbi:MAG: ATP synthase F1 subunit gamma [Schleiferiaceae bacterium]|jgi:F-type H+-transporting ATPase subunit gamma|nr:ATP synthase F1 subunit gamma [Schleiferiaceae bacterium]MDP4626543.1 ATP synthase F1 subunit gamma [Schleiferiaceae bacterium]MDP4729047.1 ATP synthase F1 subunit gamma [Schleiferiaceae bacterium]MDP4749028.1 ATP synthase F1 subunit gamma [Schleiferiaceae bacterium]MDP4859892.1 ATP synthase F1 subunit gamma [Schleiferiaceae bacterium]